MKRFDRSSCSSDSDSNTSAAVDTHLTFARLERHLQVQIIKQYFRQLLWRIDDAFCGQSPGIFSLKCSAMCQNPHTPHAGRDGSAGNFDVAHSVCATPTTPAIVYLANPD